MDLALAVRLTLGRPVAYDCRFVETCKKLSSMSFGLAPPGGRLLDGVVCHGCSKTQKFEFPHRQPPGSQCHRAEETGVLRPVQHGSAFAQDLPKLRPLHGPPDGRNSRNVGRLRYQLHRVSGGRTTGTSAPTVVSRRTPWLCSGRFERVQRAIGPRANSRDVTFRDDALSKIAFLFPGQGAQMVGMGRAAAESLPAARQLYERASVVLGYDLARLCFEGPAEELDSTVISQPALFVTSLAAIEQLRHTSPEVVLSCEATAGLSLGEYTALVFAGAMEFEDGLRLVAVRGEAMQEAADATPSGMVSILGLEPAQVESLCQSARADETLQIANLLCPGNIVISGTNSACERAAEMAVAAGAMKAMPLAVAGAFHTSIMNSAVERLKDALAEARIFAPFSIPVISNVDALPHFEPDDIREILVRQIVSPVRWEDSMRLLLQQGYDQFYEVGPGRVLRGLLKRIERRVSCQGVFE